MLNKIFLSKTFLWIVGCITTVLGVLYVGLVSVGAYRNFKVFMTAAVTLLFLGALVFYLVFKNWRPKFFKKGNQEPSVLSMDFDNEHRIQLIHKKYYSGGLSPDEAIELDKLNQQADRWGDTNFPIYPLKKL